MILYLIPVWLYGGFSLAYCLADGTWIVFVLGGILLKGIVKAPIVFFHLGGDIFDEIKAFIILKIFFAILAFFAMIFAFLAAVSISSIFAMFTFPFYANKDGDYI